MNAPHTRALKRGLACFAIGLVGLVAVLLLIINNKAKTNHGVESRAGFESPLTQDSSKPLQIEEAMARKDSSAQYGLSKVCFSRSDQDIYVYDLVMKRMNKVVEGHSPDISPDGEKIAFTVRSDQTGLQRTTIRVIDVESGLIREFPSITGPFNSDPRWSHDGSKLAFLTTNGSQPHVGILNLESGNWEDVTKRLDSIGQEGVRFDSWLAGDQSVLCHDFTYLYELAIDGSTLQKIPMASIIKISSISSASKFSFSQDRKRLLFNGFREVKSGAVNLVVYLYDFEKHTLSTVTPKTMDASEPKWLPSGREIMFSRLEESVGDAAIFDLCITSVDSPTVTTIIKDASNASYSTK